MKYRTLSGVVAAVAMTGSTVASAHTASGWHTVATFKGDAIGNIQPFTVGSNWRVVWSAAPGKMGPANFVVDVHDGSDLPVDSIGNVIGNGGSTSYEHGAGTYYLSVLADEKYVISIQTQGAVPRQPTYRWTTVYKTSGNSMGNTQSFKVKAPWRIVWTASPGSIGVANFTADIKGGTNGDLGSSFANVIGADSGVDYEYTSGTFYINTLADENYTITVQQGH